MAMGCPVITCRQGEYGPYHGPEAAYIVHSENGILCDYTSKSVALEITKLLNNPELLQSISVNARKKIQEEASVDNFMEGFKQALNYLDK